MAPKELSYSTFKGFGPGYNLTNSGEIYFRRDLWILDSAVKIYTSFDGALSTLQMLKFEATCFCGDFSRKAKLVQKLDENSNFFLGFGTSTHMAALFPLSRTWDKSLSSLGGLAFSLSWWHLVAPWFPDGLVSMEWSLRLKLDSECFSWPSHPHRCPSMVTTTGTQLLCHWWGLEVGGLWQNTTATARSMQERKSFPVLKKCKAVA